MEYVALGSTQLSASVAGLGCGGSSRLGTRTGNTEEESVNLVKRAVELGINFFDTAEAYGTEEIVGLALQKEDRGSMIVSTKTLVKRRGEFFSGSEIRSNLEKSLRSLKMDYVDIYHLHAVLPEDYARVKEGIVPVLLRAQEEGKIRYLGITESPPNDPKHEMLVKAFEDEFPFHVVMLGFHLMHQNARTSLLPLTLRYGIGTLIMFAVRSIFSDPDYLLATLEKLSADGEVDAGIADLRGFKSLLMKEGAAESIIDAAYRYARHEPGAEVVLLGTGNQTHLEGNVKSILKMPLDQGTQDAIAKHFSHLEGIGLDLPKRSQRT